MKLLKDFIDATNVISDLRSVNHLCWHEILNKYGTKDSGVIVGVASHSKNEHDSKTLELALTSSNKTRTTPIKRQSVIEVVEE